MVSRVVDGLIWAQAAAKPPEWWTPSRTKGAKAEGRRYERRLGQHLGQRTVQGQWFRFQDKNGLGWCQTDFLLPLKSLSEPSVLVLECKYTYTFEGHDQVEKLYAPVIERAWNRRVYGIVVCRRVLPDLDRTMFVSSELDRALAAQLEGQQAVWHWLG